MEDQNQITANARQATVEVKTQTIEGNKLQSLKNVGPATLKDLHLLGISTVEELKSHTADELYERIQIITKTSHDPCVWDVFAAAIHEAQTGEKLVWWKFTKVRKGGILDRSSVEVNVKRKTKVTTKVKAKAKAKMTPDIKSLLKRKNDGSIIQNRAGNLREDENAFSGSKVKSSCDKRQIQTQKQKKNKKQRK